ncbi:DUF397 domain-containing protein [Streptomyces sp. KL2]|uniref:DUF397 domain-containing protein n=1 Tax=Streptomyces sp. KL2 TaxID=3050126 RepID=UPI00397A2A97
MTAEPAWFKSSYSSGEGGRCVEVAARPGTVHVRDSKDAVRPGPAWRSARTPGCPSSAWRPARMSDAHVAPVPCWPGSLGATGRSRTVPLRITDHGHPGRDRLAAFPGHLANYPDGLRPAQRQARRGAIGSGL